MVTANLPGHSSAKPSETSIAPSRRERVTLFAAGF
jgi:hypothetical protein